MDLVLPDRPDAYPLTANRIRVRVSPVRASIPESIAERATKSTVVVECWKWGFQTHGTSER